jgi:hypothetical protein
MAISIPDLQTGNDLISRISLTNPSAAVHDLERIFDSLRANPPDDQTYFQLLEQMRRRVVSIADDLSRRYVNKPLPLGDVEDILFRQVVMLWLKTAKAYAHCARKSPPVPKPPHDKYFATLLHRCIYFTGMTILEHHRARQEVPWGLWLDLHGHYKTAESLHLETVLPDALEAHTGNTPHGAATYLAFILCDMAGSYSLTLRDQMLVRRWAIAWSGLVDLHSVTAGETLPPFVVDLMQDVALRPVSECLRTDQIRCFDTSRLAAEIKKLRLKLRQRLSPSQLALGEDCTSRQCARLLSHLAHQWSQARAARKFRRHATSGIIHICTGFEEMHYFISGKIFRQPENARFYSRRDFEYMFAFGFQDNPQQMPQEVHAVTYSTDTWEVVNQSANGFRLARSVSGRKMMHSQLLALRPNDSPHFFLAQTTWLMQESKGGLIIGVRALPGLPQAICARLADSGKSNNPYERAFLMPALVTADAEQSLVLPAGWFRPGKIVEILTDTVWRARLKNILDAGPDFERVSFEALLTEIRLQADS